MRKIHRDMTRDEQDEVRKMEEALSRYVESVEKGDLGEDIISRSLRDKLRSILTD
jgi:hypothetical protein